MKFFITFMLVLLMMVITGISAYVLHLEQEDKISNILERLSVVEKEDKGLEERQLLAQGVNKIEREVKVLGKMTNNINSKLLTTIDPAISRNRQDIDIMTQEMDLYCAVSPARSSRGNFRYPVNESRYSNSGFCGELFTADDCGLKRLAMLPGVNKNGTYTSTMVVNLKEDPSYGLKTNLERLGFVRDKTCLNKDCHTWLNTEDIDRSGIRRLKIYADELSCSNLSF